MSIRVYEPNLDEAAPERDRVLIYGPPGSGKSTYARALAEQGYGHLEREMFSTHAEFKGAVGVAKGDRLTVVRCCFTPAELDEWQELMGATRTYLAVASAYDCKSRVHRRHNRRWRGEVAAIERWFAQMEAGVAAPAGWQGA